MLSKKKSRKLNKQNEQFTKKKTYYGQPKHNVNKKTINPTNLAFSPIYEPVER